MEKFKLKHITKELMEHPEKYAGEVYLYQSGALYRFMLEYADRSDEDEWEWVLYDHAHGWTDRETGWSVSENVNENDDFYKLEPIED